jgi:hypothetical protein
MMLILGEKKHGEKPTKDFSLRCKMKTNPVSRTVIFYAVLKMLQFVFMLRTLNSGGIVLTWPTQDTISRPEACCRICSTAIPD